MQLAKPTPVMHPGAQIAFFQLKERKGDRWTCTCGCGAEFNACEANLRPSPQTGKPRQLSCGCKKRCPRPHTQRYTDAELMAKAFAFSTPGEVRKADRSLYQRLYRRGLLAQAFSAKA